MGIALESSTPVLLFEQHRTPYRIETDGAAGARPEVEWIRARDGGPSLAWPRPSTERVARWTLRGTDLVARVRDDRAIEPLLRSLGGRWKRRWTLRAVAGDGAAAVWERQDGSVLLPFDPNEAIENLWTERYLDALTPGLERALGLGRRAYYGVRPLLPRPVQIAFRRRLARRQARTSFPRWPAESSLHDLYHLLYDLLAGIAGTPIPVLAPWPAGRRWAFVLTHDVESHAGFAGIEPLRRIERRYGLVSAWNFVPERSLPPAGLRRALAEEGCEIGVHGLRHDGRDLASASFTSRLPAMQAAARAWGAEGFRAPAMQRSWSTISALGFDHDSSFPDTDPFQPCRGGCCSWWPLLVGEVVELPLTLAQDHTLFAILDEPGPRIWREKVQLLRARQGLAQVLVHPDYVADGAVLAAYEALLDELAGDPTAWFALPSQVSSWWRARAATTVRPGSRGWEPSGPAAHEAVVTTLPEAAYGAGTPSTETATTVPTESRT